MNEMLINLNPFPWKKQGREAKTKSIIEKICPAEEVEGEIMVIKESVEEKKSSKRSHTERHNHRTHQNKGHKARPNNWSWPPNFSTIHRHKYHHVL